MARYALALLLAAAGVFAFYWFENQWPGAARVAAVVVGVLAGVAVFMTSAKGHQTRDFLYESRFELRKVVWPTRQEATRMTWVVILVVVIIALLLAGFDAVIQWLVKLFLAQ